MMNVAVKKLKVINDMNLNANNFALTIFFGLVFVMFANPENTTELANQFSEKTAYALPTNTYRNNPLPNNALKSTVPNALNLPRATVELNDRFNQSSAMPMIDEPIPVFKKVRKI